MSDTLSDEEARLLWEQFWERYKWKRFWEHTVTAAEAGDATDARLMLQGIAHFLEKYGDLPEPLRGYAVRRVRDVLEGKPRDAGIALHIDAREKHRKKGSGQFASKLVAWYWDMKRKGIDPTWQRCDVPCSKDTFDLFMGGELRRGCDLLLDIDCLMACDLLKRTD